METKHETVKLRSGLNDLADLPTLPVIEAPEHRKVTGPQWSQTLPDGTVVIVNYGAPNTGKPKAPSPMKAREGAARDGTTVTKF